MLILSKMFHRPFSSVVCTVVMIYCIVIIYLPSMVEAETNFIVSVITMFHPHNHHFQHSHNHIMITAGSQAMYYNSYRAEHLKCLPG